MDKFCEERVQVLFGTKCLEATLCVPTSSEHKITTAVILTHGAGGDMNFSHLVSLAHSLASKGFLCLRFTCKGLNLVYRVKAYRAVWHYLKSLPNWTIKNMFFGGRSMGCRAAAALAKQLSDESEGAVQGVVCLSFPLHPRDRLMPINSAVKISGGYLKTWLSSLFQVLFEGTLKKMSAQVEVFWLSGGSHGLKVLGRSEESVLEEVNSHVITWLTKWGA